MTKKVIYGAAVDNTSGHEAFAREQMRTVRMQ